MGAIAGKKLKITLKTVGRVAASRLPVERSGVSSSADVFTLSWVSTDSMPNSRPCWPWSTRGRDDTADNESLAGLTILPKSLSERIRIETEEED
ncbi:hypothetical protein EJB05_01635, partial [Eragrostis curvula]